MTSSDFRRIALSLPGVEESAHMGHPDFRVDGRIFATLASEAMGYGNLKLTPELQAEFLAERSDLFLPIAGGWGRMGMTHIRLSVATEDELIGALRAAWNLRRRAGQKAAKPPTKSGTGRSVPSKSKTKAVKKQKIR